SAWPRRRTPTSSPRSSRPASTCPRCRRSRCSCCRATAGPGRPSGRRGSGAGATASPRRPARSPVPCPASRVPRHPRPSPPSRTHLRAPNPGPGEGGVDGGVGAVPYRSFDRHGSRRRRRRRRARMSLSVTSPLRGAGQMFALALDTFVATFRRPFQWKEMVNQSWFVASVTILPTALVSIPFGAVIALQVGGLVRQLGAQSFVGSTAVLAVVREASPIVTALLIAGAGGSAVCADIGSRKIREEIDAMEVLGINPIQRLVVPRVLAMMLVALLLNGLVSVVGVCGGYFFNVVLQGGTPGAYLASFTALAQLPDLYASEVKALVFGALAAI